MSIFVDFVYLAYCAGGGHFESSPLGNRGPAKCEAMAKSSYIGPRDPKKSLVLGSVSVTFAPLYHTLSFSKKTKFFEKN